MADPDVLREFAREVAEKARAAEEAAAGAERKGLLGGTLTGNLPNRNFRDGYFEGAEKLEISLVQTGKAGCWACPINCRPAVRMEEPYCVDPAYAGPPYETMAVFGSNCGVDDVKAVARASHLCNAYSLDAISTGGTIAFAMECFENGLIGLEQTDGLALTFGNAEAMLAMVEKIARREGLGDILAEGSRDAAQEIVRAVTGWDVSLWEAMKQGERVACMARAYNVREGLTPSDDDLPERFFQVPSKGSLREKGIAMSREVLRQARSCYYGMMGWDRESGVPTSEKLEELDIGWVADELA